MMFSSCPLTTFGVIDTTSSKSVTKKAIVFVVVFAVVVVIFKLMPVHMTSLSGVVAAMLKLLHLACERAVRNRKRNRRRRLVFVLASSSDIGDVMVGCIKRYCSQFCRYCYAAD
jgi:hypothetical protein